MTKDDAGLAEYHDEIAPCLDNDEAYGCGRSSPLAWALASHLLVAGVIDRDGHFLRRDIQLHVGRIDRPVGKGLE
jgi:hypothetical protein